MKPFKKETYKGELKGKTTAYEIIPFMLTFTKFEYDKPGAISYSLWITPFFSVSFNHFKK